MVDSVSTVALETLRDLFIEEVKFLSGVDDQVEEVRRELHDMQCFLNDADKRKDRYDSETVRNWVLELKDLANRAGDVLERYAAEVTWKRSGGKILQKFKRLTCILGELGSMHQAGKEAAKIKSRMTDLTKKLESITNGEGPSNLLHGDTGTNANQRSLRQTYGHEIVEHFVGMKDDIDLLVSHAIDEHKMYRVISICGMGGLGKTTLARKIYQNRDVQMHFDARVWVCITQKLQAKTVFHGILKQLVPEEIKGEVNEMDEDVLVTEIYKILKQKKCLVVLDDIWEDDHWIILSRAFPFLENFCKVLITTRNTMVANTEFVYKLKCLTEEESWDLLQKIALPTNNFQELLPNQSKKFEKQGRKIVLKCGCLPLAISVIGGILRENFNLREWRNINNNIDSYLKHGDGVDKDTRITHVLNLSYDMLPYYLKQCFLYMGCYAEDEDINSEKLYMLWMAEGMVSSEHKGRNETLREVAERYLNELGNRCMVQVARHAMFQSCRLHDLMRELCLNKGQKEEFFEVMDYQRQIQHPCSIGKTQRLAILFADDVIGARFEHGENKNLQSLLVLHNRWQPVHIPPNFFNFGMFKSLKTLKLEGCTFKNRKLPRGIKELTLLKHFSIENSEVDELPLFFCKLPYLQSLNLETFCHIKLPHSIGKMRQLRHLLCDGHLSQKNGGKLKLGGLNKLEMLIGFYSSCDDANDVLKLTNLRCFSGRVNCIEDLSVIVGHITNLGDQLRKTNLYIRDCNLGSKESLLVFKNLLKCRSLVSLVIVSELTKLPVYKSYLYQNLVELNLKKTLIEEDPMETLEHLPMLQLLDLWAESFVGRAMVCRAKGFLQLTYLRLFKLPNLVEWRVDEGAMPKLTHLHIGRCTNLEMIPEGLRFIATLQELTIKKMPQEFNDRLQIVDGQPGKDHDTIKHIPSIKFR